MQARNSEGMPRPVTTLGQRLKLARERRGFDQERLAAAVGKNQTTISRLENGKAAGSGAMARICQVLNVSIDWLEGREEAEPDWLSEERHQLSAILPKTSAQNGGLQAHQMSQENAIINPTKVVWECVLEVPLPERFALDVRDTAVSGMAVGDIAIFVRSTEIRPGRVHLIKDGDGNVYIRRVIEKKPGHWIASSDSPAFMPLDSAEDGLQVLAIQVGHQWG